MPSVYKYVYKFGLQESPFEKNLQPVEWVETLIFLAWIMLTVLTNIPSYAAIKHRHKCVWKIQHAQGGM